MCNSNQTVHRVIYFQDSLEVDRKFTFTGGHEDLIKLLYGLATSPSVTRNSIDVVSLDPQPPEDMDDEAGNKTMAPVDASKGRPAAGSDSMCSERSTSD